MERIMVYNNPEGPVTEAYRTLCTNVLVALGEKKILEVAGVAENSNISTVTANLAVAMAQMGKTVLVVECNLRNPKLHELFGLQNNGLAECATSGAYYKTFIQSTPQANLFVLAAGTTVTNPTEALLRKTMENLLNEVKEPYDVVLLDAPSVETVSDAVALGTKTDGVLLVVTNKQDKVEQAQKAKEMFTQAGVNILGCILDKA